MTVLQSRPCSGGPGLPVRILVSLLVSVSVALAASPAEAVTITVKNANSPGEGFNDPKGVVPVGGNPRTTLGAQRFYVFQYAADLWGARLAGKVPVIVAASFDNLGGTSNSATLGFAAPNTLDKGFAAAPLAQAWYTQALANELAGVDRNEFVPGDCPSRGVVAGKCAEIYASFNAELDGPVVLGAVDFYYGIDGNSGTDIDFLSVVLHEIGHGLGVLSLVSGSSGKLFMGSNDAYTNRLENDAPGFTPKRLSQMADNQRLLSIVADSKLVFRGPATLVATDSLTAGVHADGAVQVYAPTKYVGGSSVSHVDTDVFPNQLMEPFITNPEPHSLAFTLALLEDVGWTLTKEILCGDANDDKKISSTDALIVLKGAVGNGICPSEVCDVNSVGGVTTTDALLVLKRAVDPDVTLTCPAA